MHGPLRICRGTGYRICRNLLIHEVDDRPFMAIEEADKLPEIGRSRVVVHRSVVAVVGDVGAIHAQANMVGFAAAIPEKWHAE